MSEGANNALVKCYANETKLKWFAVMAFLTMASYVTGMIWMLATKKTKGDEEYWETVGEVIERGFWALAFGVMMLFGLNNAVLGLVAMAVFASLPRGVYAVYTMAK